VSQLKFSKKVLASAVLALALVAGTAGTITLNFAPAHASCTGSGC
jgi:hypothetical protein